MRLVWLIWLTGQRHCSFIDGPYRAARVATRKPLHQSSVNTFYQLDWMPIQWCIVFKLASITFEAMHTVIPTDLSSLLTVYRPSHVLR